MEVESTLKYHSVHWEKIYNNNKANSLLVYYIILGILK